MEMIRLPMQCNILYQELNHSVFVNTEKQLNSSIESLQVLPFLEVRVEDADDNLPGHGVAGVHGQPLDHRLLDPEAVREVREHSAIFAASMS